VRRQEFILSRSKENLMATKKPVAKKTAKKPMKGCKK